MPFDTPGPQQGDFFTPEPGTYLGVSKAVEDGPTTERDGKPAFTMRWSWELLTLQRQPVLDEKHDNEPAEVDALSGTKMTPKAKARAWFAAHLNRAIEDGENPAALVAETVGKTVMLVYSPDTDKGVVLSGVLPFTG